MPQHLPTIREPMKTKTTTIQFKLNAAPHKIWVTFKKNDGENHRVRERNSNHNWKRRNAFWNGFNLIGCHMHSTTAVRLAISRLMGWSHVFFFWIFYIFFRAYFFHLYFALSLRSKTKTKQKYTYWKVVCSCSYV